MSDFPNLLDREGNRGVISTADPRTPASEMAAITETGWEQVLSVHTANLAFYMPVLVKRPCTVLDMGIYVVTTGGNLDLGIYTWAGTRVASSGSTATAANGTYQKVAITDTALAPGWHIFGMSCSSSAAIFRTTGLAAAIGRAAGFQQESVFPLPTTATFAAYSTTTAPVVSGFVQANG